jgi:hypothetical protein
MNDKLDSQSHDADADYDLSKMSLTERLVRNDFTYWNNPPHSEKEVIEYFIRQIVDLRENRV